MGFCFHYFLVKMVENEKSEGTLFSSTLKVGENKVFLVFSMFGHFCPGYRYLRLSEDAQLQQMSSKKLQHGHDQQCRH